MSANDFTLDELQIIHLDMTHNIIKEKILTVAPGYIALRDKIEIMINNYCDHDFVNTYNEREVWQCSKCGNQ